MIKLEHITKYYNKNKINQITVCNDVNLSFKDTGLVVILGPSGSGKTTLLNVISGMDNFDEGKITFAGEVLEKYSQRKWDQIRKNKIGYVYQNYHLITSISVYKNIEPMFKMQGITDESIISEKVAKLLKIVNLENYSDRLVRQLSGGEQQRVAFARALANNPDVILADEPTGNLDGKTTIELMNLIKLISKNKLVVLVTHEKALCNYYADRIIKISNGKIVEDKINKQVKDLDYIQEHIITLSDFKKSTTKTDGMVVNRFTDSKIKDELNIDLIERNKTLYVKIESDSLKRTKYIDSDSEIVILNKPEDHVKKIETFDLYDDVNSGDKNQAFTLKDSFKNALERINIFKKKNIILYLVLFLVGIVISVSIGLIGEIYNVSEPFVEIDSNYITVYMNKSKYDTYNDLYDIAGVDQIMLVNEPFRFKLTNPKYYELRESISVYAQPIDIKYFDEENLIYGSLPNEYDIVIDQSVADVIINENRDKGLNSYKDVINCEFKLQTNGTDTYKAIDTALYFKISGIANGNSQSVWMKEELIYSFVTPNLIDYRIMQDGFEIVSGDLPVDWTRIMLNENYPSVKLGDIPYNIGITAGNFYISGVYRYSPDGITSYDFRNAMVSELPHIKDKYFNITNYRHSAFELLVYSEDVKSTLVNLETAGYEVSANVYEPVNARQEKLEENQVFFILGIGGILISAFSILLIMRASLISRMYEVGVYRNIGISRKEIRRIFLSEIIITTTLSSVLGYLLTIILLTQAESSIQLVSITHYTWLTSILVIIGLYIINITFGLIPINILLTKTPSAIMKLNDM